MGVVEEVFGKYQRTLDDIEKNLRNGDYRQAAQKAQNEAWNTLCSACKVEFQDLASMLHTTAGFCPASGGCSSAIRRVAAKINQMRQTFNPDNL